MKVAFVQFENTALPFEFQSVSLGSMVARMIVTVPELVAEYSCTTEFMILLSWKQYSAKSTETGHGVVRSGHEGKWIFLGKNLGCPESIV